MLGLTEGKLLGIKVGFPLGSADGSDDTEVVGVIDGTELGLSQIPHDTGHLFCTICPLTDFSHQIRSLLSTLEESLLSVSHSQSLMMILPLYV